MQGSYDRKQRLAHAHPWITERQATQLLSNKYLNLCKGNYNSNTIQILMENQMTLWSAVDEERMRDLVAMAQEWV